MDSKGIILSGILALIMVSSGFFLMVGETSPDNDSSKEEEIQQELSEEINSPPNVFVADAFTHLWNGENATIEGFILDEAPTLATVSVTLIDSNSLQQIGGIYNSTPTSPGSWVANTPVSQPGTWIIQIQATDAEGLFSNVSLSQLTIIAPEEDDVVLSFLWIQPEENSDIGTLQGYMIHAFPNTCNIEYHPLGQSPARLIDGDENSTTGEYSMHVNTSYHNTDGDLIATCGLFSQSTTSIRLNLPVPPEPETDLDGDGVLDEEDDCDSTPEGEPVYATGCSDSETDDDADGVMNDKDICPNTPNSETVDNNGCSESQKDDDSDGVNNVLDQCPNTLQGQSVDVDGCSDEQKDSDNDGVNDALDQCPNTPIGDVVGADGCTVPDWEPEESWLCQNGQGPWVKDFNGDGNSYNSNTNGVNSAGGGGSGPWFQCEVSVTTTNGEMVVDANGIPNHDFLSTMGCCTDEVDLEWHIPLNPVNDTSGGHDTSNCPASAGRWECAPDRGAVAVSVNGAPIYGVEEGPGGDAIALNFKYFNEDRQPIVLGYCTSHSAGNNFHYHYDAQCSTWVPGVGETISDYDWTKLDNSKHSPIIGWAFDGYPIYGMYGNDGSGGIKAITSSYEVERTQENGDQGYNGIDDWNYVAGVGDLDECNGRWGPTPEYPEGTYHYVSTPLSGSTKLVTDTDGNQVPMIGMPYFLLCYHGVADLDAQPSNGQGGGGGGPPGPPGGNAAQTLYSHMPELFDSMESDNDLQGLLWDTTWVLLVVIGIVFIRGIRNKK
ncbi:MAG TPA: YHYH protein [Candidatus Poseidoniaceae archaeon]|nr:YHYH protein [Candidatus Poseidoniaceae archaeon]